MITKFRIGYPYASADPDKTREAAVVFKTNSDFSGYTQVFDKQHQVYTLPATDQGPAILNSYPKGVVGELLEVDDDRKSIAKTNGMIHGQGTSMQLALVLAACAVYQNEQQQAKLPLLLFSAAIQLPSGAKPFIDATVETYCTESEARECLPKKYSAAKKLQAKALVLPVRDAKILAQELKHSVSDAKALQNLSTDDSNEQPLIIGVGPASLASLAQLLGISKFHYQQSSNKFYIAVACCTVLMAVVAFFVLQPKTVAPKTQPSSPVVQQNKQAKEISAILKKLQNAQPELKVQIINEISITNDNSVTILIEVLQDPNQQVRQATIQKLGDLGSKAAPAVPLLVKALQDRAMRGNAMKALVKVGAESAPALIEALANRKAKYYASQVLHQLGAEAIPALIRAMEASNGVKSSVITTIALIGPDSLPAVPALITALQDPDKNVRYAASKAFKHIGPRSIPALVEVLQKPDEQMRYNVLEALSKMGAKASAAIPALIKMLPDRKMTIHIMKVFQYIGPQASAAVPAMIAIFSNADQNLKRHALETFAVIGPKAFAAVPVITESLQDKSLKTSAIFTLGKIGPQASTATPALIKLLDEDSDRSRIEKTLCKIGAKAVPLLIAALEEQNYAVRLSATRVLGCIGSKGPQAVPILAKAITDPEIEIRRSASYALYMMGRKAAPAVPALTKAVADPDSYVRRFAVYALAGIGAKATPAVPALIKALKDSDRRVRIHAKKALLKIAPQSVSEK